MERTYACDGCGGTFIDPEGVDIMGEAHAVFRPEELVDTARVCDDCWQAMRSDMSDLDARYQEQGL